MSPVISSRRRPAPRVRLAMVVVVLLAVAGWRLATLGRLLHHEDPLQKADVLFALGGTRVERVAECGDLYLEGWAPRILLSRQERDGAEIALARRGIVVPSEVDLQRETLIRMGVPAAAIESVDAEQNATTMESDVLAAAARARGWHRVIVVTSKLHTARAALSMRRRLEGAGIQVIVRASRYDPADVDRWWQTRATFRFALFEAQKLFAYWIHAAD